MERLEEVLPFEGMRDPLKMRFESRQMFERWLFRSRQPCIALESDDMIDELSILDLSEHYRLEYLGGAVDVVKTWNDSKERVTDGGPNFDELVRLGWVFFDGGRWVMQRWPLGTFAHITFPSPSTKTFLTGLHKVRLVAKTGAPPPAAKALAARMVAEGWLDRRILTRDPGWLAGRLWERLCSKPQPEAEHNRNTTLQIASPNDYDSGSSPKLLEADSQTVDRAFLEWSAWCDLLEICRWELGWGLAEKQYCREAAFRTLERQTLWGTWDDDAERYSKVLQQTFSIPTEQLRHGGAPRAASPSTLVFRSDWLKWPDIEHHVMGRLGRSTVSFAFGLLCSELEESDTGASISAVAATVIPFAADRPMAFQHLLFRVGAAPALLVDLLMHPKIACLAAKLIIEWRPKVELDADRNVSREAQTKAFAVQDALSLLSYHLHSGMLDLEEFSALITWCYDTSAGSARPVADSRHAVGRKLIGMMAREEMATRSLVLQFLMDQAAHEDNIPRARFAGALDGFRHLSSGRIGEALEIVLLYSKFARDLNLDWSDAPSLSTDLSAQLVSTALAQTESVRDSFLVPFDSTKLLRDTPYQDRSSIRSRVAKTLRVHVRLLARAVAGWPHTDIPSELFNALQALMSRSIIEHEEKGRVGALTERYILNRYILSHDDGSPAEDIAAAWRRLDRNSREAMLLTLAQSDDPILLAELCQNLPSAAKSILQTRLRQLKPGEASTAWTWPELQRRIESLLTAGEYELAREHLDKAQRQLDRAPQEFRLIFFSLEARLLLNEENWTALDAAVIPSELDRHTAQQARDQLDFYRAVSQLLRKGGNLAWARLVLQRLSARPGAAFAYRENLFAIAIQQIIGPSFHTLSGEDKVRGETLLSEMSAVIATDTNLVSNTFFANRALLMLALQRPDDAMKSIATRRHERRSSELEVITVLAKSQMGFRDEAMAILDSAIIEFGVEPRLVALKNDLQTGEANSGVASPSVVVDSISSIRVALQQLTELHPSQVGDILGPPGHGVRGYLIRQVSRAVAALQHMGAMLRGRKNTEDEARFEDDLNTAVREVLGALLAVARWDLADQSLGGATVNGNPGERDAVIRVSGQEISIYEALVCSVLDRANIKKHFYKLLSYGVCDIYFHVTYSYAKALKPLLEYIEYMLEHEAPPGFTYLEYESLGPPNFETSGYAAIYRVDHRKVAVVFFVVDLRSSPSPDT